MNVLTFKAFNFVPLLTKFTFAISFTFDDKVNFGMKIQFCVTLITLPTNWTNQWNFIFNMQPRNLKIQDVQITVMTCVAQIQFCFHGCSLLRFSGRLKRLWNTILVTLFQTFIFLQKFNFRKT